MLQHEYTVRLKRKTPDLLFSPMYITVNVASGNSLTVQNRSHHSLSRKESESHLKTLDDFSRKIAV